ncbi:MAG: hypothetical protein P8Y44_12335, partial [Acidobacteriota bacterium]
MKVLVFVILPFVIWSAAPATAESPEYRLIQPNRNQSGAILRSWPGNAYLDRADGYSTARPLRRHATLTTLTEVSPGWIAAGVSQNGRHGDLVLISIEGAKATRLSPPEGQDSFFRLRPTILSSESTLHGLSWLEGPDIRSLTVHLARRGPEGWSDTVAVPRRSGRGQTGLTAVDLADGASLLVWAEFDGTDDDLFFSRLEGDSLSPPRRIVANNAVPDITPSLVSMGGEILLAWSQLESGDYRIKISHFDGETWSSPRTFGPPGAQRPDLRRTGESLSLVYRQAWPRSWIVAELGTDGRSLRSAGV